VRLEPGRFEHEDARFTAARFSVRGAHRWDRDDRSGAFLFRYGSWTMGAVVDETGVRVRPGTTDRWLERHSVISR
jgi:hypothetical protein